MFFSRSRCSPKSFSRFSIASLLSSYSVIFSEMSLRANSIFDLTVLLRSRSKSSCVISVSSLVTMPDMRVCSINCVNTSDGFNAAKSTTVFCSSYWTSSLLATAKLASLTNLLSEQNLQPGSYSWSWRSTSFFAISANSWLSFFSLVLSTSISRCNFISLVMLTWSILPLQFLSTRFFLSISFDCSLICCISIAAFLVLPFCSSRSFAISISSLGIAEICASSAPRVSCSPVNSPLSSVQKYLLVLTLSRWSSSISFAPSISSS